MGWVVKCFDCIGVGTSSHKQVSGMNMDHRVLLVRDDQLLEIVESQVVIAQQIGAFASEYVSFVERLVEFKSNREVLHGFIEDAQTSISPSSGEMELTGGLFLFCNRHVEVIQRIIKLVHLIIQQSSEEIQTRLLLFFAAAAAFCAFICSRRDSASFRRFSASCLAISLSYVRVRGGR